MKEKLHILFLCGWYPSKVLPTNGDFIQRHAEAISLLHKVSVLHIISDKNLVEKTKIENKTINGVNTFIGYTKHTQNPILKFIRFWQTYVSILKKVGSFNVVHLNTLFPFGLFALHLKWFKKKPFIISEHWTRYLKPNSKSIHFIEKKMSKLICKNASFICPVSNFLGKSMQEIGLKGNYVTVGNVINTNVFSYSEEKNKNFTITHVSSMLDDQKNISGMLRVAKQLENKIGNFTWQFIGGDNSKYQKLISELDFKKAKIEFINHISQKELTTYLQQANLYVSFSNYETFGVVMIEALACNTPVISTNTGILPELKNEGHFKIINIKNEEELLNSILDFKEEPINKSKKIHTFIANNFGQLAIANQFSSLYFKSLKN